MILLKFMWILTFGLRCGDIFRSLVSYGVLTLVTSEAYPITYASLSIVCSAVMLTFLYACYLIRISLSIHYL